MTQSLFFYPFEQGALANIADDARCAAIECDYASSFDEIGDLKVFNSFKPQALKWRGYEAAPMVADHYDYIFLSVPKQKIAAQALIAKCLSALKLGGYFICVAANDAGGKTLEKMVKAFGFEGGVAVQSLSKSKCRIVVAQKKNLKTQEVTEAIEAGASQKMAFGEDIYITQPGLFGWNKIDRGSYLLTQEIAQDLKGTGADFGCGYGYLSRQILKQNKNIRKFYVIDADYHALECAKGNLAGYDVEFLWEDLTNFHLSNLDFIVMNPPFHAGKKADHDIGVRFIENAAKSLKKSGTLYLVANAHLPYEKILNTYFSNSDKVQEQDGFKIFRTTK